MAATDLPPSRYGQPRLGEIRTYIVTHAHTAILTTTTTTTTTPTTTTTTITTWLRAGGRRAHEAEGEPVASRVRNGAEPLGVAIRSTVVVS